MNKTNDDILDIIRKMQQDIEALQKTPIINLTIPPDGFIVVPIIAGDPASPTNGMIWYNSVSGKYKGREGGVTKTFTTT